MARQHRSLHALFLALSVALSLSLAACAQAPSEPPSIGGTVSSAEIGDDGTGTLMVEASPDSGFAEDRASVSITPETRVRDAEGGSAEAADITVGALVDVWFTGPVAESYPVQATASDVTIVASE